MRTHFVVHESFEAPGAYEDWARALRYEIGYSRVSDGDALPGSADGIDLLIVLGGPQRPSTTTKECGHWHNDMPGLTDDTTVPATSEGCPRQIVAYSRYVYGFQRHLEFTPDCIEALIAHDEKELAAITDRPYVQQPDQLRANDYTEMNAKLMTFLDRLAADHAGC
ncbi:hypothetical protein A6A06_25260 [Streptomyces sp. CB02923]|uniref:hypothetical protein n=1 Tax=Streptomyces sp. CB02923 TaxID=1718985 RepID=UPI00093A9197|nr:hypothetical protein [Streptomyces sp. CB02923]OKH98919.1 hypothetical protein A6A06_25260 [Streptomyces sp. CB02923]